MNIKGLIQKLAEKPQQQSEVQFVVWTKDGDIVCADMSGAMTADLMRVFAKHAPKPPSSAHTASPSSSLN